MLTQRRGPARRPAGGMGIEFHEIRKGDRHLLHLLHLLLRKLSEKQFEDTLHFELQARVTATLTTAYLSCDFRGRALLFNVLQPRSFASETTKVVKFRAPDFRRAHKLNLVDHS